MEGRPSRNLVHLSLAAILLVGCQAPGRIAASKSQFPADARVASMRVNGLSCPLCAHNIHLKLMEVPGVRGVHVDLGAGMVSVALSDTLPPSQQQLGKAVDEGGFTLVRIDMGDGASKMICSSCSCKTCSCVLAGSRCGSGCSCQS
jgi:copper chaperone CopZ